jgi:hypothetical protein
MPLIEDSRVAILQSDTIPLLVKMLESRQMGITSRAATTLETLAQYGALFHYYFSSNAYSHCNR